MCKDFICVIMVSGHVGSIGKTLFLKVNTLLKIIMPDTLRTLESVNQDTFVKPSLLG